MKPLIIANWKMHKHRADGSALLRQLIERAGNVSPDMSPLCDVVVCPPAILLPVLAPIAVPTFVSLGGQDCHAAAEGAYTGDIAAPMLSDMGATHVIVGHSERRATHGETDAIIAAKAKAALAAGLIPVICVGESAHERDHGQAENIVADQIKHSLPPAQAESAQVESAQAALAIAYEPVWAIGSGRTPSLTDIGRMHAVIRHALSRHVPPNAPSPVPILYGGSVTAENAADILAIDGVDGALVGGASLRADSFWPIITAANLLMACPGSPVSPGE